MQIFRKKNTLINCISLLKQANEQIGFVPTMGALHKGHLSLIEKSKEKNTITIVSIFVNPTQFNNQEDLEKYPETLKEDLNLLKNTHCNFVFIPSVEEMYAKAVFSKQYSFDGIEHQMEGKFREGHFNGVATIIELFFEIIQPNNAYFGEKDFQQLQIVKKLVEKENLPTNIIGCAIFRENDGLAMSSRNVRLSKEERSVAPFIYQTLSNVLSLGTTIKVEDIYAFVNKEFNKQTLLDVDYFTIAEEESLLEAITLKKGKKYRAFIAVTIGGIRLIDTISLPIN
jgi:pantoate--beta-alanine ligase